MNNNRRKQLTELSEMLEVLRSNIDIAMEDEQEYIENVPENLQESERYQNAEEAVCNISDAIDSIDEAIASLTESIN